MSSNPRKSARKSRKKLPRVKAVHNAPLVLRLAHERISRLMQSRAVKYGRKRGNQAMRSDHAENVARVIACNLRSCCLAKNGAFLVMDKDDPYMNARVLTVPDVEYFTGGMCEKTIDRAYKTLFELGLQTKSRQIKRRTADGIEVSPVVRSFTPKFWEILGLLGMYLEALKDALHNVKVRFTFKLIKSAKGQAEAEKRFDLEVLQTFGCCKFRRRWADGGKCYGGPHGRICTRCKMLHDNGILS